MESIQHFYNVARRKLTPVSDVLASDTHDWSVEESVRNGSWNFRSWTWENV